MAADWNWEPSRDPGAVARAALRYCPEFPLEPAADTTYESSISCYEDYRLVRLSGGGEDDGEPRVVYGLYATGDFRPLDRQGRSIRQLDKVGPVILRRETALDYVRLRLSFELPAIEGVEGGAGHWQPAILVESFDDLPVAREDLPEGIREELQRHFSSSPLEVSTEENQEDAFEFRAFVLLRHGVRRDLARVSGSLKSDGTLIVSEPDLLTSIRVPNGSSISPLVAFPLRTRVPLLELDWRRLFRSEHRIWYEALDDFDVRNDELVLRVAELSFYSRYKLLEVLEREDERYRRSYALVAIVEERPEVRPMDGRSAAIHAVNAIPDELQLTAATVNDYLRFFSWSVHGEEGPFSIPATFRELSFEYAPTKEQRRILRESEFSIRPVTDEEAERLEYPKTDPPLIRRRAQIAHGSALFEAWFAVSPSGLVGMVHDEPRVADLPLHAEQYGREELFVLRKWTELRGERPTVRHYLQGSLQTDEDAKNENPTQATLEEISAQSFYERLSEPAEISRVEVTEPLILGVGTVRGSGDAR